MWALILGLEQWELGPVLSESINGPAGPMSVSDGEFGNKGILAPTCLHPSWPDRDDKNVRSCRPRRRSLTSATKKIIEKFVTFSLTSFDLFLILVLDCQFSSVITYLIICHVCGDVCGRVPMEIEK